MDRNVPKDCEYVSANAGSESRFLEERINLSQARIEELENPPQHSNSITLTKPYSTSQLPSRTMSPASTDPPLYITEKLWVFDVLIISNANATQVGYFHSSFVRSRFFSLHATIPRIHVTPRGSSLSTTWRSDICNVSLVHIPFERRRYSGLWKTWGHVPLSCEQGDHWRVRDTPFKDSCYSGTSTHRDLFLFK